MSELERDLYIMAMVGFLGGCAFTAAFVSWRFAVSAVKILTGGCL